MGWVVAFFAHRNCWRAFLTEILREKGFFDLLDDSGSYPFYAQERRLERDCTGKGRGKQENRESAEGDLVKSDKEGLRYSAWAVNEVRGVIERIGKRSVTGLDTEKRKRSKTKGRELERETEKVVTRDGKSDIHDP